MTSIGAWRRRASGGEAPPERKDDVVREIAGNVFKNRSKLRGGCLCAYSTWWTSENTSGVARWLACWAHNPKVRGSKPRSATVLSAVATRSMGKSLRKPLGLHVGITSKQKKGCLCAWSTWRTKENTSKAVQRLACWAHNPKVRGMKPRSATVLPAVAARAADGQWGNRIGNHLEFFGKPYRTTESKTSAAGDGIRAFRVTHRNMNQYITWICYLSWTTTDAYDRGGTTTEREREREGKAKKYKHE